jgi:hypothetical protein
MVKYFQIGNNKIRKWQGIIGLPQEGKYYFKKRERGKMFFTQKKKIQTRNRTNGINGIGKLAHQYK